MEQFWFPFDISVSCRNQNSKGFYLHFGCTTYSLYWSSIKESLNALSQIKEHPYINIVEMEYEDQKMIDIPTYFTPSKDQLLR